MVLSFLAKSLNLLKTELRFGHYLEITIWNFEKSLFLEHTWKAALVALLHNLKYF